MLIDVLKYHHEDYDIYVRTDSIEGAWQRFKGRIGYRQSLGDPGYDADIHAYCSYGCEEGCTVELLNPDSNQWETINPAQKQWPVIYETNRYQITILLRDIDHNLPPCVRHVRKDVEDFFSFDWLGRTAEERHDSRYGRFDGTVDFVDEPGLFRLGFDYTKNGKTHTPFITFDVVSPKLDVKSDYLKILDEVNREFEGYLFRYLSLTVQNVGTGRQRSLEIWMQVFQDVVRDYIKNVERIIQNPHSKVRTQTLFAHADRIKRWTPQMEEVYGEKNKAGELDQYYFRYEVYENTVNSMENRFVKHTLVHIGKKLQSVFQDVLSRNNTEISDSYRKEWTAYQTKIQHLLKHPFFQAVGQFEGMQHESLVLQSRMGYQQIYKDWLKLRRGIDFYTGATNIGTLQIWEIYELWCFIKVKNMVLSILGIDPKSPLIQEPNGPLVTFDKNKSNRQADYRVEITYPSVKEDIKPECQADETFVQQLLAHQGDKLTLHYQHTFSRCGEDDQHVHTMTTEQRPDIILNIFHQDTTLTYLYDAKYRVWSDTKLDKEMDNVLLLDAEDQAAWQEYKGADEPPADAINQMHRYRDAIYYGMTEQQRPESKEIIGGFILFPGRGDDASIAKKFYSKSIASVNIGAFPLLPCGGNPDAKGRDTDGAQLYDHLRQILLLQITEHSHVKNAIPQRGLEYSIPEKKFTMAARIVTQQHMDWIKANKWYNIPLDKVSSAPDILKAQQVLLIYNKKVALKAKVVKNRIEVWNADTLVRNGYPKPPMHDSYLMIRLSKVEDYEMALTDLNKLITQGVETMAYYFVEME